MIGAISLASCVLVVLGQSRLFRVTSFIVPTGPPAVKMIVTRALSLVPRAVNRQTVAKMSDVNYKGAVSDLLAKDSCCLPLLFTKH